MIEEVIIHVGMHQTGCSAIQDTLSVVDMEDVEYLHLNSPNHSGFLSTMLMEEPHKAVQHVKSGRTVDQVLRLQKEYRFRFSEALQAVSKKRVLISAEYLSRLGDKQFELEQLKSLLLQYCKNIRIVGYVNPPAAHMIASFQQILKAGFSPHFDRRLAPCYRSRFETLDLVFGRENVELYPFVFERLFESNVVLDFAQRIGVSLGLEDIVWTDEALSLEATALLYVFRHHGAQGWGYKSFHQTNNQLIELLSGVGENKFAVHSDLIVPILDEIQPDIDWISDRVDDLFLDVDTKAEVALANESELLRFAMDSVPALLNLIDDRSQCDVDWQRSAHWVDRLARITGSAAVKSDVSPTACLTDDQRLSLLAGDSDAVSLLEDVASKLQRDVDIEAAQGLRAAAQKLEKMQRLAVKAAFDSGD